MDLFKGDMDLRCRYFSVKMYVKTKELDPVEVGRAPENFVCRSANGLRHAHRTLIFGH